MSWTDLFPAPPSSEPTPAVAPRRAPWRAVQPRHIGMVVAAVALLLGLAVATWTATTGDSGLTAPAQRYPLTPPAEWGPEATWASAPLAPDARRPVAIGDGVVLTTAAREIALVDAASGEPRWRARLPDGQVHTAPTPTRLGGEDVLVAHIGTRLVWWRVEDGHHDDVELPEGAGVTTHGAIPLIALGGRTVAVLQGRALRSVEVPADARALAAHEDGQITCAGPTGWWHLRPGGETAPTHPWERPGARPTVVAYSGGFILTVEADAQTAELHVYADRSSDVRYVFGGGIVLPGGVGGPVTWTPSPNGEWGILGRTLVDLRDGRVEDLGSWSTRSVIDDRAYGHLDGRTVIVGPGIPRGLLEPHEAVPEAVTPAGALVLGPPLDDDGSGGLDPRVGYDVLYLLPERSAP